MQGVHTNFEQGFYQFYQICCLNKSISFFQFPMKPDSDSHPAKQCRKAAIEQIIFELKLSEIYIESCIFHKTKWCILGI